MECIVAYALLALLVDLLHEIVATEVTADEAQWINRRLWGDGYCDCRTVRPSERLLAKAGTAPTRVSRPQTHCFKASSAGLMYRYCRHIGHC